jgi:hypothetical protein
VVSADPFSFQEALVAVDLVVVVSEAEAVVVALEVLAAEAVAVAALVVVGKASPFTALSKISNPYLHKT